MATQGKGKDALVAAGVAALSALCVEAAKKFVEIIGERVKKRIADKEAEDLKKKPKS